MYWPVFGFSFTLGSLGCGRGGPCGTEESVLSGSLFSVEWDMTLCPPSNNWGDRDSLCVFSELKRPDTDESDLMFQDNEWSCDWTDSEGPHWGENSWSLWSLLSVGDSDWPLGEMDNCSWSGCLRSGFGLKTERLRPLSDLPLDRVDWGDSFSWLLMLLAVFSVSPFSARCPSTGELVFLDFKKDTFLGLAFSSSSDSGKSWTLACFFPLPFRNVSNFFFRLLSISVSTSVREIFQLLEIHVSSF